MIQQLYRWGWGKEGRNRAETC